MVRDGARCRWYKEPCYVKDKCVSLTPELEYYYCQPLLAPASWWKGLDGVRSRVLITAGDHEVMLDQIIETGTMISHHVKDTATMVEPEALHEEVILKFATGEGRSRKEYDAMVGFLSRAFRVEVR